jgi:predicted DNA-binding transcriptional regulator YafY
MAQGSTPRRSRQIVRVLGILKVLLEGGGPSVRDFAARFRTTRETIYRDLRVLEEVGYPLTGDASGRFAGRPRLDSSSRQVAPPIMFTQHELAALVWAVKRAGARQPFHASLGTAVPKLQALAGRGGRAAASLDRVLAGWERGVKNYEVLAPLILRLVEAILLRRRCRIVDYRSPLRRRPTTFLHDPYRLVYVDGGLYTVGKAPEHDNRSVLAVERIGELQMTDETFAPDPAIDVKRYEAEAFGVSWERPMKVVVRFSADQAPFVREREWHPTQELRELADGRLELRFRAGGVIEISRWVLSWADAAEVIAPQRLRRIVATALRKASVRSR